MIDYGCVRGLAKLDLVFIREQNKLTKNGKNAGGGRKGWICFFPKQGPPLFLEQRERERGKEMKGRLGWQRSGGLLSLFVPPWRRNFRNESLGPELKGTAIFPHIFVPLPIGVKK